MNACDLPLPTGAAAPAARVTEKGSRIHRFKPAAGPQAAHSWHGVPSQEYKAAGTHHCGVLRAVLAGGAGEKTSFQLRYFEIAPGGFTTLERHRHEHVVVVLRGAGRVRLGEAWQELGFGDAVYVAPDEAHQLRNDGGEPFGFLCVVDRQRDPPVPLA